MDRLSSALQDRALRLGAHSVEAQTKMVVPAQQKIGRIFWISKRVGSPPVETTLLCSAPASCNLSTASVAIRASAVAVAVAAALENPLLAGRVSVLWTL